MVAKAAPLDRPPRRALVRQRGTDGLRRRGLVHGRQAPPMLGVQQKPLAHWPSHDVESQKSLHAPLTEMQRGNWIASPVSECVKHSFCLPPLGCAQISSLVRAPPSVGFHSPVSSIGAVTSHGGGAGGSGEGGNGGGEGVRAGHLHALAFGRMRRQTQPPKVLVSIVLHDAWNCGKLVVRKARLPLAVWWHVFGGCGWMSIAPAPVLV